MYASVTLKKRRFGGYEVGNYTISVSIHAKDAQISIKLKNNNLKASQKNCSIRMSRDEAIKLASAILSVASLAKQEEQIEISKGSPTDSAMAKATLAECMKTLSILTPAEQMEAAISTLTKREGQVLKMRFGIGYDGTYKPNEIGRLFNLTSRSIRQIEKRALKKLEDARFGGVLKSFLAVNKG